MKGSPARRGSIKGTIGHRTALRKNSAPIRKDNDGDWDIPEMDANKDGKVSLEERMNYTLKKNEKTNSIPWDEAPPVGTIDRQHFYDTYNIEYDNTIPELPTNTEKIEYPNTENINQVEVKRGPDGELITPTDRNTNMMDGRFIDENNDGIDDRMQTQEELNPPNIKDMVNNKVVEVMDFFDIETDKEVEKEENDKVRQTTPEQKYIQELKNKYKETKNTIKNVTNEVKNTLINKMFNE